VPGKEKAAPERLVRNLEGQHVEPFVSQDVAKAHDDDLAPHLATAKRDARRLLFGARGRSPVPSRVAFKGDDGSRRPSRG
jgi:hypothetical protein